MQIVVGTLQCSPTASKTSFLAVKGFCNDHDRAQIWTGEETGVRGGKRS
jgi:hypothetical protein